MISDDTRKKIENIIRGIVIEGESDTCTSVRNHLCGGFGTSTTVKEDFEGRSLIKEEQAGFLRSYARAHGLDSPRLPGEDRYLTRGGESKVYLDYDNRSVIKLNDGVYYATWLEFFNSLVIHNLLFPDTAYTLLGFEMGFGPLEVVVKQPYIRSDGPVDLEDVRELLAYNGFAHIRRYDYYNQEFGLLLEDIHDENVIMNAETLFFIDTVFYVADGFLAPSR